MVKILQVAGQRFWEAQHLSRGKVICTAFQTVGQQCGQRKVGVRKESS